MPANRDEQRHTFGLLPEPERSPGSFLTSTAINGLALALALYIGATARRVIQQHQYEETVLILPEPQQPEPPKAKLPPPPKIDPPKLPEVKLETQKINVPRPEPRPDVKPILMEAKLNVPAIRTVKPAIVEAPQPKAALAASMPAQTPQTKVSTVPVHFGQAFGVTPNPNATRPATVAAIGNPYGGNTGQAIAPHGVVGGTGIGNGIRPSAGNGNQVTGRVASAGIPGMVSAAAAPVARTAPVSTNLEVLSKPPVQYTAEARQLRVQGDVVLRVTFTASGQVQVQGVVHGLGHGLDEEARRVAQQIRFRPATKNGQAVDLTTNITISFQLA